MRLVAIKQDVYEKYKADKEILNKSKRPYVLVLKLKYKGHVYNFAVPLRSNIPAASPKGEYFPLPPRKTTRPKNRHGLHYIKMFPITKQDYVFYRTKNNAEAERNKNIIDRNYKLIIEECQTYLNEYENGIHPQFSTDIDFLLNILKERKPK